MVGIKRGFALRKETSTARAGKNWNSLQESVVKERKHNSCSAFHVRAAAAGSGDGGGSAAINFSDI